MYILPFQVQSRLDQFRLETQKDQFLQTLICYTINGWPEKHQIPKQLCPYYSHRSEIMYHEGILLKNQRIIMPTNLGPEMRSIIHQGHFGLENSKKRARQALSWPLINNEIEDIIKNCPTCLTSRNRQPSEPAIKYTVPREPQTKLAADSFQLYGHYYLLVADYNSKFTAVENLQNLQSLTVINKCKKIFSYYGIPK